MKKFLGLLLLLLVPVLMTQRLSTLDCGALRNWVTSRSSKVIRVGVEWPFEANQDGMEEALRLAQEELNAQGVKGRRIELVMRDDHLDPEEARKIAIDFATDPRMDAVVGCYDDSYAVRASALFEQSRLLHIVAGANNSYMTSHGFQYLIRSVVANDKIGPSLARMCLGLGYHTYALISEKGNFGEDLSCQFANELDAHNARVVYLSSYVRGQTDFRGIVNDLKMSGADMILVAGFDSETAAFIRTARDLGLETPILGSFNDTTEVHAIAGRALEGVMTYDLWDVDSPGKESRAFVAKYRARYHKDPTSSSAQGYDALRLLARAVEITGSTNGLDLSYALRYMKPWEGVNGTYKFDSTGEMADKPIYLYTYLHGKRVLLRNSLDADALPPPPLPAFLQTQNAPAVP